MTGVLPCPALQLMEQLVLGKLQLLQFVPIGWLLRLWRFSDEFKQDVLYPIIGSFNGTGGPWLDITSGSSCLRMLSCAAMTWSFMHRARSKGVIGDEVLQWLSDVLAGLPSHSLV